MEKTWCFIAECKINKKFCENKCPLAEDCGKNSISWIDKELMRSRSMGWQPTGIKKNEDRDVKEILDELTGRRGSREFELKSEAARSMGYVYMPNKQEEKNPKQILIDWVKGVRESAEKAKGYLNYVAAVNGYTEDLDEASDCISDILGQCKAMEVVLNNSD